MRVFIWAILWSLPLFGRTDGHNGPTAPVESGHSQHREISTIDPQSYFQAVAPLPKADKFTNTCGKKLPSVPGKKHLIQVRIGPRKDILLPGGDNDDCAVLLVNEKNEVEKKIEGSTQLEQIWEQATFPAPMIDEKAPEKSWFALLPSKDPRLPPTWLSLGCELQGKSTNFQSLGHSLIIGAAAPKTPRKIETISLPPPENLDDF